MEDSGIISSKAENKKKGNIGEAIAVKYLKENKIKILETNYKNIIGEIDIIALDNDNRILFIEVKMRSSAKFGYPREAVNYKKQQKIRRVAELYLKMKKKTDTYIRFDVIEILGDKVTYIKSAF